MAFLDLFTTQSMIILAIIAGINVLIAIIFTIVEKRLNKELEVKNSSLEVVLRKKFDSLKKDKIDSQSLLEATDVLAREFFSGKFGIGKEQDYSELASIFQQKGKKEITLFCQKMLEARYSGESLERKKAEDLFEMLRKIVYIELGLNIRQTYPSLFQRIKLYLMKSIEKDQQKQAEEQKKLVTPIKIRRELPEIVQELEVPEEKAIPAKPAKKILQAKQGVVSQTPEIPELPEEKKLAQAKPLPAVKPLQIQAQQPIQKITPSIPKEVLKPSPVEKTKPSEHESVENFRPQRFLKEEINIPKKIASVPDEQIEYHLIKSIDNLERIKDKIKQRKSF